MLTQLKAKLSMNYWTLTESRDFQTWRGLKMRLTEKERKAPRLEYRLRSLDVPLLVRPDTQDTDVIWEIFYMKEYEYAESFRKSLPICSVLDCGANAGFFAAYLPMLTETKVKTYVGAEPNTGSFALLQEQVERQKPAEKVSLHNVAVSDRDGAIRFHTHADSRGHHIAEEDGELEVPTLRVATLLDRAGVDELDLLKVDIEGGEKTVMSSIGGWKDRVKMMVVELHPAVDASLTYDWFASIVRAAGYTPFPNGTVLKRLHAAVRRDVPLPRGFAHE
jgi:FkbM family methyltransferase